MSNAPEGQRFSHIYLRQPELLADSLRMRNRLAVLYGRYDVSSIGDAMERELGVRLGLYHVSHHWPGIMQKLDLADTLDSVTIAYLTMFERYEARQAERLASAFIGEARRIFREEQVRYRIDDKGGVHFNVDAEFERIRVSTIATLGAAKFQSARELFDDSFRALDGHPPDGKAGIRSAFFAVENLFRIMFPSAYQLSVAEVQKHMKPLIDKLFEGEKPAIYVAQKQLASFCDWIDGAHFYRHEPGTSEPAQPPLKLAIYVISQAGSHLRWLGQLGEPAD